VLLVVLLAFFPAYVLPDLLVALQELRADLTTTSVRIEDAFHEVGCAMETMIVGTGQMNITLDVELLLNDLLCHHIALLDDLLDDQLGDLLVKQQHLRADLTTTSVRIEDAFHEVGCAMETMIVGTGQTNITLDAELLLNDLQCHHDDLLGDQLGDLLDDQQEHHYLMALLDLMAFA